MHTDLELLSLSEESLIVKVSFFFFYLWLMFFAFTNTLFNISVCFRCAVGFFLI